MENILKIVFLIVILGLGYYLYKIVRDPIIQERKYEQIKQARVDRLLKGKQAQMAYRSVKGTFADNWDSLLAFVKNDRFPLIRTIGDPNVPDSVQEVTVISDTSYVPVRDSLFPGFAVDSLPIIPMTKGKKFEIDAGTITKGGVTVPVFQITDKDPYRPGQILQVGSMYEANYSGNWE